MLEKKLKMSSGFFIANGLFCNQDGRIQCSDDIIVFPKIKCRQIGITEKGIHAYRRTINSKMRCEEFHPL